MQSSLLIIFASVLAVACGDDSLAAGGGSGGGGPGGGAAGGGAAGGGGEGAADAYDWGLPPGYPLPKVPAENPMSAAKVELGQRLFFDTRLSGNETFSCGTCHKQALAFTDGVGTAVGSTGQPHPRGSMSTVNVGYLNAFTWANPVLEDLEAQALVPMFGESPVELGLAGMDEEVIVRLSADADYPALFAEAFPEENDPIQISTITYAIAAFQRSIISYRSAWDRYNYDGQASALSDAALRGRELFFGERLECFHCHGGFNFSDSVSHEGSTFEEVMFHNTGLYNLGGTGDYPEESQGLYEFTGDPSDMGRFRAPTLRNIALTAPYFHDGSAATLDDVLDHYAAGGRTIASGPNAGVGSDNPWKSELVTGFTLTAAERADVIAFLQALTDEELLSDPRYENPWE